MKTVLAIFLFFSIYSSWVVASGPIAGELDDCPSICDQAKSDSSKQGACCSCNARISGDSRNSELKKEDQKKKSVESGTEQR